MEYSFRSTSDSSEAIYTFEPAAGAWPNNWGYMHLRRIQYTSPEINYVHTYDPDIHDGRTFMEIGDAFYMCHLWRARRKMRNNRWVYTVVRAFQNARCARELEEELPQE